MTTAIASLGKKVLLGSSIVSWTTRDGFQPNEQTFDMVPEDAQALADAGAPVSLEFKVNGIPRTIKNLWVMDVVPGPQPQIARVRVSDRRWLLKYSHFLRRYNMRRNVGYQRVGENAQPALNPVVPKVWYWKWSLKRPEGDPPGAKWQPSECLDDILQAQVDFEQKFSKGAPGFVIAKAVKQVDRKLSVENLVVDDSGDQCLTRVVALFPESGLYVDDDGQYVVYSRNDGMDEAAIKALGPEVIGGGHIMLVKNKNTRPKYIDVRFSLETELRLDYIENEDGGTLAEDNIDKRQLFNVIPVPDYKVTIAGETVSQHTPIDIDRLITCTEWSNHANLPNGRLSHKFIQRAAIPFLDLWGKLELTGTRDPDSDWAARVAAINAHWRKTFQIQSRFMDRILSIKDYRVGLVSPVNGKNAMAQAYCDHSYLGTVRSFFKNVQGNHTHEYAINIDGYPPTGAAPVPGITSPAGALSLDGHSKAAPAIVSVLDSDQGLIHVAFGADPNHIYEAALPGKIVRADGTAYTPTADVRKPRQGAVTFDSVTNRQQIPKLSGSWKLAVILTAVPASPNDERQLFEIRVRPNDIKDMLPPAAQKGLSEAAGPPWQVRVGPGQHGAKALVRWLDSRAQDIEAIFGVSAKEADLSGLVLNHRENAAPDSTEAASIDQIARALAASIYAKFADHFEGEATGHLTPAVTFGGFMQELTQEVTTKGEGFTRIRMRDQLPPIDFMSYLDSSTRAILMRQPQAD